MNAGKRKKVISAISAVSWWITDKAKCYQKNKTIKYDADTINNLERLYNLKKIGAINEDDYIELKEKLKSQIAN